MSRAFGVDISRYQSSQDGSKKQNFDALKNHTEEVVFIRCSRRHLLEL